MVGGVDSLEWQISGNHLQLPCSSQETLPHIDLVNQVRERGYLGLNDTGPPSSTFTGVTGPRRALLGGKTVSENSQRKQSVETVSGNSQRKQSAKTVSGNSSRLSR